MSRINLEDCHCLCHAKVGSEMKHAGACCGTCPHCGKENIKTTHMRRHQEGCPDNPANKTDKQIKLPTDPSDVRA